MLFIGFAALLLFLIFSPGFTPPIKNIKGINVPGSIASLQRVIIGGLSQWILIRGIDITKPILLFLHGGPGTSEMCLLRNYSFELEQHFIVVTWDQRGTGKSYKAISPHSALTIHQFVLDTVELTQMLCDRFDQKKIFLIGHSWGSGIGILSVQKYPNLYHAYIGIGQISNMKLNERISYNWTLEKAIEKEDVPAIQALNKIGEPPYTGKWQKKLMTQRRYLGKYGGEIYGSSQGAFPLIFKTLLFASEYTLLDKVNFFRGILESNGILWPQLLTIDLNIEAPKLEVPVYFVLGKHDYEVPSSLSEEYFSTLQAPKKELIWFEKSAHFANIEEFSRFNTFMIEHVLTTYDK